MIAAHSTIPAIFRIGAPAKPMEINALPLLMKRPVITGSLIGGMKETQEMLDFCGKHNITSDIENIPATPESIKKAYERTLKADVKYRFVLDILDAFKWVLAIAVFQLNMILINREGSLVIAMFFSSFDR